MTCSNANKANKAAFNAGSNFCREGQFVLGKYYGNEFSGTVTLSRVKYGGRIQHTVELLFPIEVHSEILEIVLCNEEELEGAFEVMEIKHCSDE